MNLVSLRQFDMLVRYPSEVPTRQVGYKGLKIRGKLDKLEIHIKNHQQMSGKLSHGLEKIAKRQSMVVRKEGKQLKEAFMTSQQLKG